MEENKNEAVQVTEKKETIKEKLHRAKEERLAKRAERKAAKADKPKTNWKKVGAIAGGVGLVLGAAIAGAAAKHRCGGAEVYDPEAECEPGDEFEEIDQDEAPAEEAAE